MGQPVVYTLGRLIVDLYANELGVPLSKVTSFNKYLGGSAANTAVGLARHGMSVGLISRVGDDEHGTFLRNTLAQERVDTRMVQTDPDYPTGLAFASIHPPSDSTVLFYRKPCADANLSVRDIDETALTGARALVVACTALAVSPGREAALKALTVNRRSGGLNILDIDWRPSLWSNSDDARIYYELAMQLADVVIANEAELEFVGVVPNPAEAARRVMEYGPKKVVAKRGGGGVLHFEAGEELYVPAVRVEVVNTLGAGDAFAAGYVCGLIEGWPLEKCLQYAVTSAAIVVSRHSCSSAMPTRAEVEAFDSPK